MFSKANNSIIMRNRIFLIILSVLIFITLLLSSCTIIVKRSSTPETATPVAIPTPPQASPEPNFRARPLQPITSPLPSITDVVEKIKPSVVSITTRSLTLDFFLQPIPLEGAGSGFIIDPRGYIITNNHVIARSQNIQVTLPNGKTENARVVGRDPLTDLAVLKIDADDLPVLSFADTSTLRVGDWVIAIGNALGLPGGPTVTLGIVSYIGRSIREPNGVTLTDLIQTDAAINPGNSGGPLVNLAGQVVGVNTAIAGEAQNIGFAVNASVVQNITTQLITRGRIVRGYLGVSLMSVTRNLAERMELGVTEGALIGTMATGSPADRAGLRLGDVITGFNGQKIATADDLVKAIQSKSPGDRVEIAYIRAKLELKTSATLIERPSP